MHGLLSGGERGRRRGKYRVLWSICMLKELSSGVIVTATRMCLLGGAVLVGVDMGMRGEGGV